MRHVVLAAATAIAIAATGASAAVATTSTADDGLTGALGRLGMDEATAAALAATSIEDGRGDTFRFAAPGSRPATLDAPYVDILRSGGAEVRWDEPPTITCGQEDGRLVQCPLGAAVIEPDTPWALLWVELAGPLPIELGDDLSANVGFPILTPGGAPWEAVPAFAWDTFQGADRWYQLIKEPGQPWFMKVDQYDGSTAQLDQTAGLVVVDGAVVVLAVPASEVAGTTAPAAAGSEESSGGLVIAQTLVDWLFGTAIHVHDGTFGQSPDDTSGVDSQPDTDSDTPRGPGGLAAPGPGVAVAEAPAPEPEATTSSASPQSSPSPVPSPSATSGTGTDPRDEGSLPIGPLIIGGALAAGFGIATTTRRRRRTCSCTMTVAIEGPATFATCCMRPEVALRHVADPQDADGFDRSRIHLDADDADHQSWDLFDAMYAATITPACSGTGARVDVPNARYRWDVESVDGGAVVKVSVTADVLCDGPVEHPEITAEATLQVEFVEQPCTVRVLERLTPDLEISHIDVHIDCGAYSEVFGFWPNGGDLKEFLTSGTPGQVNRWRTSQVRTTSDGERTLEITDKVGDDYKATGKHNYRLRVFVFQPSDCSACVTLRSYYERLTTQPGLYTLLGRNCATTAYDGLVNAGLLAPNLEEPPLSPSETAEFMDDMTGNPMGPVAEPTIIDNTSRR